MSDAPDKRYVLAVRAYDAGLLDVAEQDLQALLAEQPHAPHALQLLATIKLQQGTAALQQGNVQAAIDALTRALELDPQTPDGWSNLGLAHQDASDIEHAEACFRKALQLSAHHQGALNNLGLLLASQGRFVAAQDYFDRALAADPTAEAGYVHRAVAQLEQGDARGACQALDALDGRTLRSEALRDVRAYAEVYVSDDAAQIAAAHPSLRAYRTRPVLRWDGRRPLRVGFVSADFRRHSVAFFSSVLFSDLPSAKVQVIGVSNATQCDDITHWFMSNASHWIDISSLDDDAAAAQVGTAGIDVLVDLSGRTTGHRQGLFAQRPAPIQMTALGYPATTGADYFNGRWVDAITDPYPQRDCLSEGAFELPQLHLFTPGPAPDVSAFPDGPFTFVSFNKWAKVSAPTLDLWSAVLHAVPDSRMLLKAKALSEPETQARARTAFHARGISPERVELRGWTPGDADHLSLYGLGHVALDSFPYTGTTTTCEALWMGVPVLTLCGHSHASRVSASLLTSAGLSEWICHSDDGLVDRAAYWARSPSALTRLRAGLRTQVAQSALCDSRSYARDLEARLLACARSVLDQQTAGIEKP